MTYEFIRKSVKDYADAHREQYEAWMAENDRVLSMMPMPEETRYIALTRDPEGKVIFCTVMHPMACDIDGFANC